MAKELSNEQIRKSGWIYKVKMQMDNLLHPDSEFIQRCPRCSAPLKTIVVHGHEACSNCKSNIVNAARETTVTQTTIWQLVMKEPRNLITRFYDCFL